LKSAQKLLKNASLPAKFIKYGKEAPNLKVRPCPRFDDLIWNNLGRSPKVKTARKVLTLTFTLLLTLGWTAVITFVNGLSDLTTIGKFVPSLADLIKRSPTAVIVLESIVAPGLIVLAFQLLLLFLHHTSLFQGIASWNGVFKSVMGKFYVFQVYQFFLSITVTSTLAYLKDPLSLNDMRKAAIKGFMSKSTFYINFTILNYGIYTLELLQAGRLIFNWLYFKLFRLVPRSIFALAKPPEFPPSSITCNLLVIFFFCILYTVVAPLIVPFATIFFGLSYIYFKYQKLYGIV
jgi:hypothetical protein